MHLFNTFMGLGALIVAGLIGATITFLLIPERYPFAIRWRIKQGESLNRLSKIIKEKYYGEK